MNHGIKKMNGQGNMSTENACEVLLHTIRQTQLDYDIHETPDSVVIFIRKTSNLDQKIESINVVKYDKEALACSMLCQQEFPVDCTVKNVGDYEHTNFEECVSVNKQEKYEKEMMRLKEKLSEKENENKVARSCATTIV